MPSGYDLLAIQGLGDTDLGTRARCAQFLARRIKMGADSETLQCAAKTILSDTGTLLPETFLTEIAASSAPWIKSLIGPLKLHVSANIRAQVHEILGA